MKTISGVIALAACLLLAIPVGSCAHMKSVPVMVGGDAESDACGAVGEVKGLRSGGDGFLAVRAGPGTSYGVVDKIGNGQLLYLCDATDDGAWLAVVYGSGDDDCGVSSPLQARQGYQGRCKAGWVKAAWIEVVAG